MTQVNLTDEFFQCTYELELTGRMLGINRYEVAGRLQYLWHFCMTKEVCAADADTIADHFHWDTEESDKVVKALIKGRWLKPHEEDNTGTLYTITGAAKRYAWKPGYREKQREHGKRGAEKRWNNKDGIGLDRVPHNSPLGQNGVYSPTTTVTVTSTDKRVGAEQLPDHDDKTVDKPTPKPRSPKGPLPPFSSLCFSSDLEKVSHHIQQGWIDLYGQEFVIEHLTAAHQWCLENPRRAPKKSFAKFFGNWLRREREWTKQEGTTEEPFSIRKVLEKEGGNDDI